MPQRVFIRQFEANQFISGTFSIQNCQLGMTRNGKPYLKCLVGDKTGRVPGRMWNTTEELFSTLPTNGFVWLEGQTQPYQGEMQVIIQQIRAAEPRTCDLADLLPCTEFDIDEMFDEVCQILDSIKSNTMRALAAAYLEDEELMARFRQAPAAVTLHHAYLGGLLEHTLSLLRVGQSILPLYPQINRDLVLMGLFLHDLGKCSELSWETGFSYSDDGHLIGHVTRGVIWLERKVEDCRMLGYPIPVEAVRVLQHIILSHHGKPEFGAMMFPATPEAILVSLIDNLDAKVNMAVTAARGDDGNDDADLGGNFTQKIWALDTRLYRPDPLASEEPCESPLPLPINGMTVTID